jgi:hypothetical protein
MNFNRGKNALLLRTAKGDRFWELPLPASKIRPMRIVGTTGVGDNFDGSVEGRSIIVLG